MIRPEGERTSRIMRWRAAGGAVSDRARPCLAGERRQSGTGSGVARGSGSPFPSLSPHAAALAPRAGAGWLHPPKNVTRRDGARAPTVTFKQGAIRRGQYRGDSCGRGAQALPPRARQAVALRRRRLRHPVAALDHSVQLACRALWSRPATAPSGVCSAPTSRSTIDAFDETNTRIRPDRLAAAIEAAGAGMVMLVGVQSNQFPRALDLARALRARGIAVAIGGFHVSGVIPMLDGADPDLARATAMGVSLFAGEAEGRLDEVLRDACAGALKPLYNHMDDLPGIEGRPLPHPAGRARQAHRRAQVTSFDAGRGCPYQCSFCTIINVQGRKSRRRSPDDVETDRPRQPRAGPAPLLHHRRQFRPQQGLGSDPRPPDLSARASSGSASRSPSRSTRSATACRASSRNARWPASRRVFIGLENINPANLSGAKKKQNKITEYRQMLLAWKSARRASPMPATSSASPTTRWNRSSTTSR